MIMVMLGGLTMWIDPKSVPARVSMGRLTPFRALISFSFRNNNCPYYFYDNNGPEIVATSRLLFDGAGHLFVDMLFLCVFRGPGILCSELFDGAKRSSQVNKRHQMNFGGTEHKPF